MRSGADASPCSRSIPRNCRPHATAWATAYCNGGVKELSFYDEVPTRDALWHERCPEGDFADEPLPVLRERVRTVHWFDPCELLGADARSELRPEFRVRQRGGGWIPTE